MFALLLLVVLAVTYFVVQTQPLKARITAGVTVVALLTLLVSASFLALVALLLGVALTWNQRESLGLKK